MPTLEQNVQALYDTSLIAYNRAVTERVARETQVNSVINNLKNASLTPKMAYYDSSLYAKSTVGGSYVNGVYEQASVTASSQNYAISNWYKVPAGSEAKHIYTITNKLVVVFLNICFNTIPGYSESPICATDHSRTWMQFIYANDSATSDEINQRITARNIILPDAGTSSDNTETYRTTAVNTPDDHPYSVLWVRFVNRLVPYINQSGTGVRLWTAAEGLEAQEITTFGGNSAFRVNNIIHYPNIAFINA